MSTVNSIILGALRKIGKDSPLKPAKPEDVVKGLDSLQSLLQMWATDNIDLGTNTFRGESEELGEPLDTRNALINNLALELAPEYDNGQIIVSETLRNRAAQGMAFLKKWYKMDPRPLRRISSTAPIGAGNEKYIYSINQRKSFGPNRVLTEPDDDVQPSIRENQ